MGELDYMDKRDKLDKINMDENLQIDEGLCGHVNDIRWHGWNSCLDYIDYFDE